MTETQIPTQTTLRGVLFRLAGVVAALVLAGGLWMTLAPVSFWAMLTPAGPGAELGVSEAYEQSLAGDIVLIDIRRPDEWRLTGVGEGAQMLDMRRKDFTEALTMLVGGNLDAPIALICARGVRSARMSNRLQEAGFTRIIDVPEGMLGSRAGPGWLARDLPTRAYEGESG